MASAKGSYLVRLLCQARGLVLADVGTDGYGWRDRLVPPRAPCCVVNLVRVMHLHCALFAHTCDM